MMSTPKKVWLSRDDAESSHYELWTTKPKKTNGYFVESVGRCHILKAFCPEDFELYTGFSLAPGKCKRVTIPIKLA